MSDTTVSVLTPAGSGAIATVQVAGPRAWETARHLFRPAGKTPLPEQPELHRFWLGRLGDGDEVILAVKQTEPEPVVEVHCHGGRRVVRWVTDLFLASGGREGKPTRCYGWACEALSRAPTLRTASILLDQYHGAFDRAVRGILARLDAGTDAPELAELASFAPLGRHLVEPWRVVVAGPPNAGKSSLVNALAGYQRSVVSEVAGTTRDVVTVPVAFDGWPVELADTAGLRDAAGLEVEGVERAQRQVAEADLIVWVMDATAGQPVEMTAQDRPAKAPRTQMLLVVINKIDRPPAWDLSRFPDAIRVSAITGEGVPGLGAAISRRLVPVAPAPEAAIAFTPKLADLIVAAHFALIRGRTADAARLLRDCLEPG